MVNVALSIGSNCGNRKWYINKMEQSLRDILSPPISVSALMETEPVDVTGQQPWYLNRILIGGYLNGPFELLAATQHVEQALGRQHKGKRLSRTADIDILLYGDTQMTSDTLTLPHPSIAKRQYILKGLCELIPDERITGSKKSVAELWYEVRPCLCDQKIRILDEGGVHEQRQ